MTKKTAAVRRFTNMNERMSPEWRALPERPLAHRYEVRKTANGTVFVSLCGFVKRYCDCFINPTKQHTRCKKCEEVR